MGTWVENMALAAAVAAPTALRQEGQAIAEVRRVLTLFQALYEALDALAQIDHLLVQPTLTAEDVSSTMHAPATHRADAGHDRRGGVGLRSTRRHRAGIA